MEESEKALFFDFLEKSLMTLGCGGGRCTPGEGGVYPGREGVPGERCTQGGVPSLYTPVHPWVHPSGTPLDLLFFYFLLFGKNG